MKTDWSKWNSKEDNFKKYKHIKSNLIYGKHLKQTPLLSIMIITYKRAEGLKNALESAINQTYKENYEIVVADDSGFDEKTDILMKEYCKKYKNIVYYRHEKNLGQYANWNRACELCRSEWYCLLHDDDMLKSNYLEELSKYTNTSEPIGLIGVYVDVIDTREKRKESLGRRILKRALEIFLRVRNKKCIMLTLKDNIKHIYVMNSTFINKYRAMDIGGLDDAYFPSSDFAFSAKMSCYYRTGFLPIRLTNKGIVGESESLKQSVCDESIACSFYQTMEMCKYLKQKDKKCLRKASVAAVIAEIGVKGYNNVDYGKVKEELGMKKIYNNKFIIFLINLYSKFNWGLLLFRKNLLKRGF